MNKNIAQDYLNAYKEQIERLFGKDIADKSIFEYEHGWFRTGIAAKYKDGSIGNAQFYILSDRLKSFEQRINRLKER